MDDLETVHQVLDMDMQWSGSDVSLEQRRQELQRDISLSDWNDGSRIFGFRAICLRTSMQMIGLCGFHPWLWSPEQKAIFWPLLFNRPEAVEETTYASFELCIGYGLATAYRGQGYASEAATALITYAFDTLQAKRVLADTSRSNIDSRRVMERVGMRTVHHPTRPDEE
jgi:RimJ/RimL family protein N-acetyltransferase